MYLVAVSIVECERFNHYITVFHNDRKSGAGNMKSRLFPLFNPSVIASY